MLRVTTTPWVRAKLDPDALAYLDRLHDEHVDGWLNLSAHSARGPFTGRLTLRDGDQYGAQYRVQDQTVEGVLRALIRAVKAVAA